MTPSEQIELAQKVVGLMNNETFAVVMTNVEEEIHATWERQKDPGEREACWQHLQGLKRLWLQMELLIERGAEATREIAGDVQRETTRRDAKDLTRDEKRLTTLA